MNTFTIHYRNNLTWYRRSLFKGSAQVGVLIKKKKAVWIISGDLSSIHVRQIRKFVKMIPRGCLTAEHPFLSHENKSLLAGTSAFMEPKESIVKEENKGRGPQKMEKSNRFSCRFPLEAPGGEISTRLISSHLHNRQEHLRCDLAGAELEGQVRLRAVNLHMDDCVTPLIQLNSKQNPNPPSARRVNYLSF